MEDRPGGKLATQILKGGMKIGAELLRAGGRAIEEGRRQNLQRKLRTTVLQAQAYADMPYVQELLAQVPENWQALDIAGTQKLLDDVCPQLDRAVVQAADEREKQRLAEEQEAERKAFAARLDHLTAQLANDGATLTAEAGAFLPDDARRKLIRQASEAFKQASQSLSLKEALSEPSGIREINDIAKYITYGRAVGNLRPEEKQTLKVAIELGRRGLLDAQGVETAFAAMVINEGETMIVEQDFGDARGFDQSRREAEQTVRREISACIESPSEIIQHVGTYISDIEQSDLPKDTVNAIKALASDGASWLSAADIDNSIYSTEPESGLFLGELEDGAFLQYDGEGSLFTIAPPGSGKTQCQVIPNLLMYNGPAIVLDVKGECYEQTAGYRSRNFGPVLRFAPGDWENSAHYNPLDFVRRDPRHLASDARKLADMLIVPQATKDPYWEQRGRDVLAAIIGYVAHTCVGHERTMKSVMDLLSPSGDMLVAMVDELRETEVPYLVRAANQIESLGDNQRASIFDSARSQLSVWDLGELDPITDRTDWVPKNFKAMFRPLTLYICVSPADIERFASVLRVIIGQHLDYFMEVLPDNVDQPIVFFLDEAPQLGSFDPLPKASSLGRQYGLRLWLFAQNRNQIEQAYESADTILGNSVVQCWMNPDENTAHNLSHHLGRSRGLFDGLEKPLAEAHELRGPAYKDLIITVGRGEKPAKLRKHFAHQDESLRARMALPIEDEAAVLADAMRTNADAEPDAVTPNPQDGTNQPTS
ncbi:MAG: type IV secretory system conjugative DNA transfer family protein [Parvibaculaceae bacterium]